MAAIAFTDAQLEQIRMTAAQIPRRLRNIYLERIVQLLGDRDFGDGDVHRAARAAAGEIPARAASGASWPLSVARKSKSMAACNKHVTKQTVETTCPMWDNPAEKG